MEHRCRPNKSLESFFLEHIKLYKQCWRLGDLNVSLFNFIARYDRLSSVSSSQ